MAAIKKNNAKMQEDIIPPPSLTTRIIGQEAAQQQFLSFWNSQKIPHALLLHGPSGIGKASFGFEIARFLLHEADNAPLMGGLLGDGGQDMPITSLAVAEDAPIIHQLAEGAHNDFRYITPLADKTQISIEQIRSLIEFSHLTPGRSGWRVVLIDKADHLTPAATNSLLKLLEEPPKKMMLILIADRLNRILPTMLSRCVRIPLSPLDRQNMHLLLQKMAPENTIEQHEKLISYSDGSIGLALQLLAEDGLQLYAISLALLANPAQDNFLKIQTLAKKMTGKNNKFTLMGYLLLRFMEKLIRAKAGADAPDFKALDFKALGFDEDEIAAAKALLLKYDLTDMLEKRTIWQDWISRYGAPNYLDPTHLTHAIFA